MKQHINFRSVYYIIFTIALAILMVFILYLVTHQTVLQKNGFPRRFITSGIAIDAIMGFKEGDITGISGIGTNNFYFQTKSPEQLLVTDRRLRKQQNLSFSLPYDKTSPPDKTIASRFHCTVDSPMIHIMAGNVPAIISGDLQYKTPTLFKFPSSLFTRAIVVSSRSFILRGFDTAFSSSGQIFIKGEPASGIIHRRNNLKEQQGDLISTDGLLHYDSATHLLAYIYFYENRILCLDTNLNLVYKGHTIDTFATSQAPAGTVSTRDGAMQTKITPSRIINRESCVADGRLFNNSSLKADNESDREFSNNSVIDVYDLRGGNYLGSFYIPAYKNEKLKRFKVFDNLIVALYKSNIVTYQLQAIGL